jgi:hypothetical protein
MPRYFFHLCSADQSLPDYQGITLAGSEAACREASRTVQDFCQPSSGRLSPQWEGWSVEVRDERGRAVISMAFADGPKLRQVEAEWFRDAVVLPNVVNLGLERAKRQFASVEHERNEVVRRTRMLTDHTRYETRKLEHLMQTAVKAGEDSVRLVARSRRQRAPGDWLSLARPSNENGGDVSEHSGDVSCPS